MSCSICQIKTDTQCEEHMIYFCSDHLNSHYSAPQNIGCKLNSAFKLFNLKGIQAKEATKSKKQKQIELIQEGLLITRDPNIFDIQEKKLYMDSKKNVRFDKLFGLGHEDRDYIQNIAFTNDKRFSFVCIKYLGKID